MKKGFISSSLVYAFLIMFLFITLAIITYDLNKEKLLGYILNEAKEEIINLDDVSDILIGDVFGYEYTGNVQTFTVPVTGMYQIELWGAQGGYQYGGNGSYTKGDIMLTKGEQLYIYVGQRGEYGTVGVDATSTVGQGASATFNGGGAGGNAGGGTNPYSDYRGGSSGGGATDIRITSGVWNDITSLRSRIMVAGGGGGTNPVNVDYDDDKSHAGGLIGQKGGLNSNLSSYPTDVVKRGNGGTQTTGNSFGVGGSGDNTGISTYCNGHSGGGGGYYGGTGGLNTATHCHMMGGGGGSSFISGHNGSNAVNSSGVHTGDPTHFSGKMFFNTVMIDGNGKAWKDTVIDFMQMPKPDGTLYDWASGHSGNGFAKITYVSSVDYTAFDVSNYNNNGLILMYDGINNGGIGIHNDNSSANKGTWIDLSGNNNDGSLNGFSFTDTSGWLNNALKFDGDGDVINLGNKLIDLFKGSTTIEIVVKFDELTARDIFIGNHSMPNSINWEKYSANQSRIYWNAGTVDTFSGAVYNNTNIMQTSLILDKSNNKIRILVNSVERYSNTNSNYGTYNFDWSNSNIGQDNGTGDTALKGNIYNIRIYNRILSSSEIMHNFLIDKIRFGF